MISLEKIQEWDRLIANMPADGSALGHVFGPYRQAMTEMLTAIAALTNALISAGSGDKGKCSGCSDAGDKKSCGGDGGCGDDHPHCSQPGGD